MEGSNEHLCAMLGPELLHKVQTAKVLMVGAGGIGCELLKDLVLTGFTDVEVVDLDTIDVSNLNRQFLFRKHHVGKSKAEVAREALLALNPSARITAHHANIITDTRFTLPYYEKFDLVFNALDNLAARSHVNRMCIIAGKPLLEAGTAGDKGQAFPILGGLTECYDCLPKPVARTYALCTIRSVPEKPVHCVVYGKELHKLLVGNASESTLYEGGEGGEGGEHDGGGEGSAGGAGGGQKAYDSAYMSVAFPRPQRGADAGAVSAYAKRVFQGLFRDDIARRLELGGYKTAHSTPVPQDLEEIEAEELAGAAPTASSSSGLPDQRVLSRVESARLFIHSLTRYYTEAEHAETLGNVEFSKDSELDLDLVTAACNLRAVTFGIPAQSRWHVKSIAGNIIPAIATSNAMVAGLQVLEAIKILRHMGDGGKIMQACRLTWLNPRSKGSLLNGYLGKPTPGCPVCGHAYIKVAVDTSTFTLRRLTEEVLKGQLAFTEPEIDNCNAHSAFVFCETFADEEELELLDRPLASLPGGGLAPGCIATVSETAEGKRYKVALVIVQEDGAEGSALAGNVPRALAAAGHAEAAFKQHKAKQEADAAAEQERQVQAKARSAKASAKAGEKRKREGMTTSADVVEEESGVIDLLEEDEDEGEAAHGAKTAKTGADATEGDDVIELD